MIVLRIHGDELMFGGSGTVMTHSPRIPQMEMMKVHIPFTFKLHESFKSTYAGELKQQAQLSLIFLHFSNFCLLCFPFFPVSFHFPTHRFLRGTPRRDRSLFTIDSNYRHVDRFLETNASIRLTWRSDVSKAILSSRNLIDPW